MLHSASKMATLGASLLLCILQCFRAWEDASARRVSHEPCFAQAHCFVQGPLRFLPVPPESHMRPLPHLGVSDNCGSKTAKKVSVKNLLVTEQGKNFFRRRFAPFSNYAFHFSFHMAFLNSILFEAISCCRDATLIKRA